LLSPTSHQTLNIDESTVQLLVLPEHEQALIGRTEVKEYFRMLSIIENLFGTAEEVKLNVRNRNFPNQVFLENPRKT
jgi:hypothetical protein